MAEQVHTSVTYTYTCDLCDSDMPDQGTLLVGMMVDEQAIASPQSELPAAQFCVNCLTRPISDLVEHFDPKMGEAQRAAREVQRALDRDSSQG